MVIKKIEIGAFGKLESYSADFVDGIQVIYGPNEFGKSTLMEFLKVMFYSKRGDKKANSEDKILRQRYTPWSGARMRGSVEFTSNGNLYKIQKEISPEFPSKDVTLILNESTGETIKLGKNEEIGEHFFGIDIKSFERSSYIKNIGKSDFEKARDSGNIKDSLADKILSNLSDTGEADISKSLVTKKLSEAIKELQPLRGIGEISRTQNNINNINQKIYDLKLFEDNRNKLMQEFSKIKALRNELFYLQTKVENAKKFRKFSKINEIIKLIDNKEKCISNLKIPRSEADSIIEKLILEKEKVENHLTKVRELKNIINSLDKDVSSIFENEVELLNLKLRKKENLEDGLKGINYLLKNQSLMDDVGFLNQNPSFSDIFGKEIYFDLSKDLNELKNLKVRLEQLKEGQILLRNNAESAEFKILYAKENFEQISTNFKKKKSWVIIFQIINFFILIAFLCTGFFMNSAALLMGYFLPFVVICGFGCFYLKSSGKKGLSLSEDIQSLEKDYAGKYMCGINENQLKISNALESIDFLENRIQKILNDKAKSVELDLSETEKIIDEMLSLKNCLSVQEYYENRAKFQSASKIRLSYSEALEDFKNVESDFVKSISQYEKVQDLREALTALKRFDSINSEISMLERKINLELSALDLKSDDKEFLSDYSKKLCSATDDKPESSSIEFEELRKRIEFLKSLNLEEKCISIQKNIKTPHDNAENLDKALFEQKSKLSDMKIYLESLQMALSVIEESSDELRKNFNPKLNARASEIFSCLTGGKYNQLHIAKDYGILVNNDMIDRSCDNFSSGTIDQAYLSLRIAISELISAKSRAPMILDDIFMQYDNDRLSKALEFLKDYSLKARNGCQIIIFTCHKHIADVALNKEMSVAYTD